jgi:hypothetical protein
MLHELVATASRVEGIISGTYVARENTADGFSCRIEIALPEAGMSSSC